MTLYPLLMPCSKTRTSVQTNFAESLHRYSSNQKHKLKVCDQTQLVEQNKAEICS